MKMDAGGVKAAVLDVGTLHLCPRDSGRGRGDPPLSDASGVSMLCQRRPIPLILAISLHRAGRWTVLLPLPF